MQVLVPISRKQEIEKAIIEQSNGTAQLEWDDKVVFAIIDKQVEIF